MLSLSDVGSAYVYVRTGTTWSQQAKFVASPPGTQQANFGYSVALSTDRAVIGAVYVSGDAGRAYVFDRTGTSWSQQAGLRASDGTPDDNFGSSVAVSGDRLIVGAKKADNAGGVDVGSAYIFTCPAP